MTPNGRGPLFVEQRAKSNSTFVLQSGVNPVSM